MNPENKCLRCGNIDLQPGRLQSTGKIWFSPDNAKFFTMQTGDVALHANICMACGTVHLIGDVKKTKSLTDRE